jgi:cytochrome c biogenesis protein CcmG/thiol:disulfide interchange protein DsbE
MMRWLAVLPVLALLGLALMFVMGPLWKDPHVSPDALVGKPLPASLVTPLSGGAPVALTSAVHGPMLLNVFASWCAPCRADHEQLLKLHADGVPIVGLAWEDKAPNTQGFLAELGDPYVAVMSDPGGRAGIDLGITGVPETFLIDADGKVVAKHSAPLTPDDVAELEARLRTLSRKP